jgi:hypothetical protein
MRCLSEIEDPDDRLEQLVFIGLGQLVARQGVQNVQQRLPSWLAGASPARSTMCRTLSHSSGIERGCGCGRGEQPEKQVDANTSPLAAKRRSPIASIGAVR